MRFRSCKLGGMVRFRIFLLLAVFLLAIAGRGFRPHSSANPFRVAEAFSEFAGHSVDEADSEDDEYGPAKPFGAKQRASAPSLPVDLGRDGLTETVGFTASLEPAPTPVPAHRSVSPELRPPIPLA